MKKLTAVCLFALLFFSAAAQKNVPYKSYQSLLWEITGNGLKKPSYLFGTMHVSNKLAFHLSDSFYNAIASCDAVSLEVNPQHWQPEMFRLQEAQTSLLQYSVRGDADYMNEKSFRIKKDYDERLKRALSEESMAINGLLYRTYQGQSDFQENTYLDLYLYQTGRRLGKKAMGVENYIESQKIMMEASEDMAKEKRKMRFTTEGDNNFDIQKKIQDAYRKGDLNTLDSLDKLTSFSDAYKEKFLYKRNDIQAASIDSILKKQSLFVGVGAAHLAGERGVIESLRRMGYQLRPIKMTDNNATQKEKVDKLKVPVEFKEVTTSDNFVKLKLPGQLFKRNDAYGIESWQYADMENGSYYMLSRVMTNAGINGDKEADVIKKVDSLLYENIPGKILEKKAITVNGYKGFDITNKTRRGDIQRYKIIATAFEVLVFKMSGNEDYVSGKEADEFFNSIQLKENTQQWVSYEPSLGGFKTALPQQPVTSFFKGDDRLDTWYYEANDNATGDNYMIVKKNINSYRFIEEDTFDLSLIEESVKGSDIIAKQASRKFDKLKGYTTLDMLFNLKDGGILKAKAIIKGAAYYLLTARSRDAKNNFSRFFNSFSFISYNYGKSEPFIDSSLKFSVSTPVKPNIDTSLYPLVERMLNNPVIQRSYEVYNNIAKTRNAVFESDSTGESIQVTVAALPKYYYKKDSLFWENEIGWKYLKEDMILTQKEYFSNTTDSVFGYRYTLLDTNTNRKIRALATVKGNTLYKLSTLTDNIDAESSFVKDFFSSFKPLAESNGYTVFNSKAPLFLNDFFSADSVTKKTAREALPFIVFAGDDLGNIKQAIAKLHPDSSNYLESKSRFITAIGRITDTANTAARVAYLKQLYDKVADTSSLANAIVLALAQTQTVDSYTQLKNILVTNPVVFDNSYEYNSFFRQLQDSLALAKTLLPEILQLTSLDDYKAPVTDLLYNLVDSGLVKAEDYTDQYTRLYFDAQVQLKKLQSRDEKEAERLKKEKNGDDNDNNNPSTRYYGGIIRANGNGGTTITSYATLLMPFYEKNAVVQKFFNQLLKSRDQLTLINVAALLLKNNRPFPDSLLEYIASDDKYRSTLYSKLKTLKKEERFPAKYKTQEMLARSIMVSSRINEKIGEISQHGKSFVTLKSAKGYVYFFKYKIQKQDDWLMGMSGVQPANTNEVNTNSSIVNMTNKKFKDNETEAEQFDKKLKQLVLTKRKSAAQFYNSRSNFFDLF